jgi:hypothetical protein
MLGKVFAKGFRFMDVDFEPCPYQIMTSISNSKQHEGQKNKTSQFQSIPTIYMTIWTHVLVGGAILYPLGVNLYFKENTMYYWLVGGQEKAKELFYWS